MRTLSTWLAVLAMAFVLAAAGNLDLIEDHSAEQAQADEVENAARQAQAEVRRETAAAAICAEKGSVNTVHVWQADGSLSCKTTHGRTIAVLPRVQL